MSQLLALYLLGPPKVELDNAPVVIDRRKTLALLAYLAVNRWRHHNISGQWKRNLDIVGWRQDRA